MTSGKLADVCGRLLPYSKLACPSVPRRRSIDAQVDPRPLDQKRATSFPVRNLRRGMGPHCAGGAGCRLRCRRYCRQLAAGVMEREGIVITAWVRLAHDGHR